jgi:multidrug efflux pump subunit AcrA (membrane-fusion protein)
VITIPAPKPPSTVTVPYSSLIYDPSGKTYVFTNIRPLTYVEVPITVDHISGDAVYLKTGPKPGARVVSVGAEELYGVQTGVLAQT